KDRRPPGNDRSRTGDADHGAHHTRARDHGVVRAIEHPVRLSAAATGSVEATPAYTPRLSGDRLEQSGFNRALINVDASLPVESRFDGLTRISPHAPETVG